MSTRGKNDTIKNMAHIPNVIYTGAFLSEEARQKILAAFPPRFKNVFAHHHTITFRPTAEELAQLSIGESFTLPIIGIAEDDKAQALVVESPFSSHKYPHITLSTAEGVEPVYSNELIERNGFTPLSEPVMVDATLGFFDGKNVVKKVYPVKEIVIPTRPQIDTLVAVFILKKFGNHHFPGVTDASFNFISKLPEGENDTTFLEKGTVLLDIGNGMFDHHAQTEKTTASRLVADYLNMTRDPAHEKMLQFAERDDMYGKGIISTDPLDKAFGLPGLLTVLNKKYAQDQLKVVEYVLPLLEAHHDEELRRTEEMPKEVETKLAAGDAEVFSVKHRGRNLRCMYIKTDNPSLAGYLRSQIGGRHDVVILHASAGNINILTRPTKKPDLQFLAVVIRRSELMKANNPTLLSMAQLSKEGRLDDIPEWYFDRVSNSIQNGGINPAGVPVTRLSREEIIKLTQIGLSEQY